MFCKKCGKRIEDDALFCRYCGANVGEEFDKAEVDKEETDKERVEENIESSEPNQEKSATVDDSALINKSEASVEKNSPSKRLLSDKVIGVLNTILFAGVIAALVGMLIFIGIILVGLIGYGKVYLFNGYTITKILSIISIVLMIIGVICVVAKVVLYFVFKKGTFPKTVLKRVLLVCMAVLCCAFSIWGFVDCGKEKNKYTKTQIALYNYVNALEGRSQTGRFNDDTYGNFWLTVSCTSDDKSQMGVNFEFEFSIGTLTISTGNSWRTKSNGQRVATIGVYISAHYGGNWYWVAEDYETLEGPYEVNNLQKDGKKMSDDDYDYFTVYSLVKKYISFCKRYVSAYLRVCLNDDGLSIEDLAGSKLYS